MQIPKSGEAHRSFEKLEGKWMGEETYDPSPLEPKGAHCMVSLDFRRDIDGFYLIGDYAEKPASDRPEGLRGHWVIGFSAKEKTYTLHWFDNFGIPPEAPSKGVWKGDTIVFENHGEGHHGRTIFEVAGKDALVFRVEMSTDGTKWAHVLEAKLKRR